MIIVGWEAGGGANTSTTVSISDNAGNAYADAARSIDTGTKAIVDLWYAQNSKAGATSVSIAPTATLTNVGVVIWEFSGVSTSSALDQATVMNSQGSTATPSGGSVTTGGANDVIVSIVASAGAITGIATGNSFVDDSTLMSNGWSHLIASSAGAYAAQWNESPAGTYAASTAAFKAAATGGGGGGSGGSGSGGTGSFSPCDLNQDGVINTSDVNIAVNWVLMPPSPCPVTITGAGSCNAAVVQRVIASSLPGGTCHPVVLNWTASTSSNVAGYNIYRSTTSGSGYVKLNSSLITGTNFTDGASQPGQTYYYVATSVDTSGNESAYSSPPAAVKVPLP